MTTLNDPWADRSFLRDAQYRTDANLAARQSIYSYQEPHIDLQGRVIDLAAPSAGETVCDVGCGNGMYLEARVDVAFDPLPGRVLVDRVGGEATSRASMSESWMWPPRPAIFPVAPCPDDHAWGVSCGEAIG